MLEVRPYPLAWPRAIARTERRKRDKFGKRTQAEARDALLDELVRLGAREIVISTDVHMRPDGRNIYANERASDPGCVAYFRRKGKQHAMALDAYDTLAGNLYGLAKVIEALRTIERHGSPAMMDAAFRGFAELPPAPDEDHWSSVLGVPREASLAEVEKAYRKLLPLAHPDRGGTHEGMADPGVVRSIRGRDRAVDGAGGPPRSAVDPNRCRDRRCSHGCRAGLARRRRPVARRIASSVASPASAAASTLDTLASTRSSESMTAHPAPARLRSPEHALRAGKR